ncbi:hypothetical protein ACJX0J_040558, partial [Zea mays]
FILLLLLVGSKLEPPVIGRIIFFKLIDEASTYAMLFNTSSPFAIGSTAPMERRLRFLEGERPMRPTDDSCRSSPASSRFSGTTTSAPTRTSTTPVLLQGSGTSSTATLSPMQGSSTSPTVTLACTQGSGTFLPDTVETPTVGAPGRGLLRVNEQLPVEFQMGTLQQSLQPGTLQRQYYSEQCWSHPPPRGGASVHTGRTRDVTPAAPDRPLQETNKCCCRNVQDGAARSFCHELGLMCQVSGMDFVLEPVLSPCYARPELVERALKGRYQDAMNILRPQGRELNLLIVILPDNNGSLYGDVKRICETNLGLVSQCCLTKHVFKVNKQQYLANVALKINVKVGGRNTVLVDALARRIPLVSDIATIIFSADVTHPHPGEDSSPSIAAVVASQDWPEVTKYAGLVIAQAHRQELIQDLFKVWQDPKRGTFSGGMIRELLISFWRATGQKPKRIIFYRDGVSEGQFYQVLLYELDAIRKAYASLESDYQPPVTFVVVQKRHHTRLFANNHNDNRAVDKSGNILPGTMVDSKICHPTEFDFYLCSHAGIQGTSRPAHYHVLWDENNFTADGLQTLTNNLCYTYARCTRSVSI